MSGITACPQCQTRFRVTTEQLQARSGEVRCGRCSHIFNAYQTWEEEAPEKPVAPTPETQSEEPQAEPHIGSEEEIHIEIPAMPTPTDLGEIHDAGGYELDIHLEPADPLEEPAPDTPVPEPAPESAGEAMAEPEAKQEPGVRVVRVQPSPEREPARATPSAPKYAPPPRPPLVWPLVVLNLMLAVFLLGQGAYFFRDWIVAQYPATGDVMASACEVMQCQIGLLKDLDLLGIESSDLHSDPDRSSLVTLTSMVRNRAPHIQAFPSLELTLTNARDEVLVRRLFAPGEYLPPATKIDQGIPAKSEVAVKLLLDMGEVKADGYRLYLL